MIGSARDSFGELVGGVHLRRAMGHAQRSPGPFNNGGITWGSASGAARGSYGGPASDIALSGAPRIGGLGEHGVMFELSALLAMNRDFGETQADVWCKADRIHARGSHDRCSSSGSRAERGELAGEPRVAEAHARHGIARGAKLGGDEADTANAVVLAQSLCRQCRFDEAEEVIAEFANATPMNEIGRTAMLNAVRADVRTHRGASVDAIALANRAMASVDRTDLFNLRAELRLTLASALRGTGDAGGGLERSSTKRGNSFRPKETWWAWRGQAISSAVTMPNPLPIGVETARPPRHAAGRRPPEDGRRSPAGALTRRIHDERDGFGRTCHRWRQTSTAPTGVEPTVSSSGDMIRPCWKKYALGHPDQVRVAGTA